MVAIYARQSIDKKDLLFLYLGYSKKSGLMIQYSCEVWLYFTTAYEIPFPVGAGRGIFNYQRIFSEISFPSFTISLSPVNSNFTLPNPEK